MNTEESKNTMTHEQLLQSSFMLTGREILDLVKQVAKEAIAAQAKMMILMSGAMLSTSDNDKDMSEGVIKYIDNRRTGLILP